LRSIRTPLVATYNLRFGRKVARSQGGFWVIEAAKKWREGPAGQLLLSRKKREEGGWGAVPSAWCLGIKTGKGYAGHAGSAWARTS